MSAGCQRCRSNTAYVTDLESVVMTVEEALGGVVNGLSAINGAAESAVGIVPGSYHDVAASVVEMVGSTRQLADVVLEGITPVADAIRQHRLDRLAADDEAPQDRGGDDA